MAPLAHERLELVSEESPPLAPIVWACMLKQSLAPGGQTLGLLVEVDAKEPSYLMQLHVGLWV